MSLKTNAQAQGNEPLPDFNKSIDERHPELKGSRQHIVEDLKGCTVSSGRLLLLEPQFELRKDNLETVCRYGDGSRLVEVLGPVMFKKGEAFAAMPGASLSEWRPPKPL